MLSRLSDHVKSFLEKEACGHDFYHAQRVVNNAKLLLAHEKGADAYVVEAAALVHDICRPWEKKTGKSHFCEEAIEIIRGVLQDSGVDPNKIEPILDVVRLHDVYDWSTKSEKTIELQIMQDADNLEAIGAIGVARTFAFGGANGLTMWHPGESLDFERDFIEDPSHRTTTIAHFYEKLLKIKDNMNTKTGRAIAEERHAFMEDFLKRFFEEWQGTPSKI